MIRSIRARLSLWYVAVLSVILAVSGTVVYSRLAQSSYAQLDSRLEVAGRVIAASIEHEIEEHEGKRAGEASFQMVLSTIHELTFPALAMTVMEEARMVAHKPDSTGHVISSAARSYASDATRTEKRASWSDRGWRYSALRIPQMKAGPYLVVTGESEGETARQVEAFRQAFLLGIPIAILLSAIAGYWLARKSLQPVVAISETVETITSKSLARRVPVQNPLDELGLLAQTFNRLLARLEQSFEQQRHFMADASHELRTPVSVAHTATEVTLEQPHRTEEEYREAFEMVAAQMRRMKALVEDMFLLARSDAGAVPLRLERFYLDELVLETVKAARVLADKRGVIVELVAMPESPCHADESLVRQMVMNLLENAVKYSHPGGRVKVKLELHSPNYRITVEDDGPGIAPEAQPLIFDRFYRGDAARARASTSGGAGLGLSIARWVAEAHHGKLTLLSSSPQGSAFCALLPAQPNPDRKGGDD